jgi:hypothetical protein
MTETPHFPPPWTVERPHHDSFVVKDANGIIVASVFCQDDNTGAMRARGQFPYK